MKIDKQTFDLEEELSISIDFEDNDGLIFIPKNVTVEIKIVNYFGKIVINNLSIKNKKPIGKTIANTAGNVLTTIAPYNKGLVKSLKSKRFLSGLGLNVAGSD